MSLKKTLILALLLCGLFYYLFKVEIPGQEEEAKKDLVFKNFDETQVDSIAIIKAGQTLTLQNTQKGKNGGKWQFADLPGAFLDYSAVSSILSSLADLKLDSPLPKEDLDPDLSIYGLKEPALILKVKAGEEKEFLVGKKNDYLGKYYLKIPPSEDIYLVPDSLYTAADRKKEDFRDKSPLEFFDSELKNITLTNEDQSIKLERSDIGDWRLIQPVAVPASSSAVSEFARNLRNLTAANIIDKPFELKEYNLANAPVSVTLDYPAGKKPPLEISFSKITKENVSKYYFYIKDGPSIYETSADPFQILTKKSDDFREKKIFSFAVDLVRSAEVEPEGQGKFSVVKDKNDWKVNGKPGDKVFIDQWLSNLSELQASSFPTKKVEYGFGNPKYKVSIEIGEGKKNLTIGGEFSGESGKKFYYAVADDPENPFIIAEDTYKKIATREEALVVANTPVATAIP
jgi:hypothetical protein